MGCPRSPAAKVCPAFQGDLFGETGLEPAQLAVAREKREQERQLKRVTGNIRARIEAFVAKVGAQPTPLRRFTASELHEAVGAAPASADRVLRVLRQEGHLNYRVIDRAASLYEVLP